MGACLPSPNNYFVNIETKTAPPIPLYVHPLLHHLQLLDIVADNTEMLEDGPVLRHFIKDYCRLMAHGQMRSKGAQKKLTWQIQWVWHVHRLHPLAYVDDCQKQLADGLVTEYRVKVRKTPAKRQQKRIPLPSSSSNLAFVPSVDLAKAVLSQRDFIDKYRNHRLHSSDPKELTRPYFQDLVQDFVSFMKLANSNDMIVPTFDIDLIWHTIMRNPLAYEKLSIALCGSIVDHQDAIDPGTLSDAYQKTAERWQEVYQSEYGQKLDRQYLRTVVYPSNCALVTIPASIASKRRDSNDDRSSLGGWSGGGGGDGDNNDNYGDSGGGGD